MAVSDGRKRRVSSNHGRIGKEEAVPFFSSSNETGLVCWVGRIRGDRKDAAGPHHNTPVGPI